MRERQLNTNEIFAVFFSLWGGGMWRIFGALS
jgi:hypothetical protein